MSQITPTPFHYNAKVVAVYDGDTCTADIDLGLGVWIRGEKLRLHRINAPEMRGEERDDGTVSRDRLRELVLGKNILLETVKDRKGKYGRYLAEIWLAGSAGEWKNVNDQLVQEGLAEYKQY